MRADGAWQKRRGLPSIPLRLVLIQKPEARELMDRVSGDGAELYDSIQEMHEANYPLGRRRAR